MRPILVAFQALAAASPDVLLVFIILLLIIGVVPLAYMLIMNRSQPPSRALLLVSTDQEVFETVSSVAGEMGYQTIRVYRHEDVLNKLPGSPPLSMALIDDSVPQAEAGLLLTALQRSGIELPPLILIENHLELEQTVRSFRADAILERPLDSNRLRTVIRTIATRYEKLSPGA